MFGLTEIREMNRPEAERRIPVDSTVFVTIGRNYVVGGETLTWGDSTWAEFQHAVKAELFAILASQGTFAYYGEGEGDGIVEESVAIQFVETTVDVPTSRVETVLSKLAANYLQDAIGLTFGPALLATS
jgi:hypothetical protein